MAPPPARGLSIRSVKGLFLTPYAGLLGLQALWHGLLFPAPAAVVALALAPLLAPLPWLVRRSAPRAPLVVAYLSLGYFIHGVTEALVSPQRRVPALVEVALCLWLCAAAPAAQRAWRR